jgi:hypothetical protein
MIALLSGGGAGDEYVGNYISEAFRPAKEGDDFFDIFQYQTGKYKEYIQPHRNDFLKEQWDGLRIDILFVDLAKTLELHDHIVKQFYPCLVAGESLLMHQDFYHCWNPYIRITMQFLKHCFENLDGFIPMSSRLFLLKEAITRVCTQ